MTTNKKHMFAKSAKAKLEVAPAQTLATLLHATELQIESLEKKKEELRTNLFKALKEQGVKAVRLENGDQYIRAERAKLSIKNSRKAFDWALENPEARMKLDTSAALLATKMGDLPFFEIEHTEYLTIRRARATTDETTPQVDSGN